MAGVIAAEPSATPGVSDYRLTDAGEDLRPVIMSLGFWGQRWVESSLSLKNLDPGLLMWDMRRGLDPTPMPPRRCTIRFSFPEVIAAKQNYWLVIDQGKVDLCSTDPGFDVDLFVNSSLLGMTSVWMGHTTMRQEIEAGKIELVGDQSIAKSMQTWLGLSPFAQEKSRVAEQRRKVA